MPTFRCQMDSPVGRLGLVASTEGLREVVWLGRRRWRAVDSDHKRLRAARSALRKFFADGAWDLSRVELDLSQLTGFRRVVSETLRDCVPSGEIVTYGELAGLSGSPGAARAVGTVMSKNPIPLFIPCHRVVASSGIGGFGPGLAVKRSLLRLEGAEIRN